MFFFQDDIGILILLSNSNFWKFIFTPVSANFAPIMQLVYFIEYKLFYLNFNFYVIVSLVFHAINCYILAKIISLFTKKRFYILLTVGFFVVNLTYTEPFLWWASQGILSTTAIVGLTFYFWYKFMEKENNKDLFYSLVFSFASGFVYGTGVGVGILFAVFSFIYFQTKKLKQKLKIISLYFTSGILSYITGPVIANNYFKRVIPVFHNPLQDLVAYTIFVLAGVGRGAVTRFFLPGFEPRHFEVFPTIISFIPSVLIALILIKILITGIKRKEKLIFIILIFLVFYPYIWAGFIRYQFGLKQALSERYAYPSLFFFVVLLVLMIRYFINMKHIKDRKLLSALASVLFILQLLMFAKNTFIFEERPSQTKKYFSDISYLIGKKENILNLPLPSYIHQEYTISQLAPVITGFTQSKFIQAGNIFCTEDFRKGLKDPRINSFYKSQSEDGEISKIFPKEKLVKCMYFENNKKYNIK